MKKQEFNKSNNNMDAATNTNQVKMGDKHRHRNTDL